MLKNIRKFNRHNSKLAFKYNHPTNKNNREAQVYLQN